MKLTQRVEYKDHLELKDRAKVEVSKEIIKTLPEGIKFIIYNPLTDTYKEETSGKNDIAHNKYAYEKLKYYLGE